MNALTKPTTRYRAIFISDIHAFSQDWFVHTFHLFGTGFTWQFGARQLLAIGVIAVFAAINCAGVMFGGRVQTALTVAQRRLPVEMTTPPFFRKVNPGDYPVMYVSLVSATLLVLYVLPVLYVMFDRAARRR